MKSELSDLCYFADGRVAIADLGLDTYVSTENMLPNKDGITRSAGLPTMNQTQAYHKCDVLVSNIRPYFRKIWFADRDGGCSNDILVLRAKDTCNPAFLYYLISNNSFFEYAVATSKGTKMPRGDKGAIMRYAVPDVPLDTQIEIADTLSALDTRIVGNKRINHHLEQMAQAKFGEMFPFVNLGDSIIGEYITPKRGKTLISKDAVSGVVPVIAGGLAPTVYHNVANTQKPVVTISASGANAGFVSLWCIPVWSSDSSYIDKTMTDDVYFWYVMLKTRQNEIYESQTGSAQPHIYPAHIANLSSIELDKGKIAAFTSFVSPLFEQIGANLAENARLAETRDTLLPRLMSGELSVADLVAK